MVEKVVEERPHYNVEVPNANSQAELDSDDL